MMDITHSIAFARDHLTQLIQVAEVGHTVQITRRGKPVAVLLGFGEYERLTKRLGTCEAYRAWRGNWQENLDDQAITAARDSSPGRHVDL